METYLHNVLEEVQSKIQTTKTEERKKTIFVKELSVLIGDYRSIKIPEYHQGLYKSLIKRGKELLKDKNINDIKKVEYYLRYCHAALYDFNENIKPMNHIIKSYLVTCVLFLVLSPQYFSFILPILFILPIFLGLKGMKKRSYNGLMMGLSVLPIGLLTSVTWLKNIYLASGDFNAFFLSIARQYNIAFETARSLTLTCAALSFVLLVSSVYSFILIMKYRKMFV